MMLFLLGDRTDQVRYFKIKDFARVSFCSRNCVYRVGTSDVMRVFGNIDRYIKNPIVQ